MPSNWSAEYAVHKALDKPLSIQLIHFIRHIERTDIFFPINQWPDWAIQSMFSKKLTNKQAWKLAYFFVMNGLYPPTAVLWTTYSDVHNGRLVNPKIDKKKHDNLIKTFIQQQTKPIYAYYDMTEERVIQPTLHHQ